VSSLIANFNFRHLQTGLTLIELVIAVALSALLIFGLVQIVSAAGASSRLQDNQAQLQENARLAIQTLSKTVQQTGFNPQPWNDDFEELGFSGDTLDDVSTHSDRLAVRSWSDLNCFDNRNPAMDSDGAPAFFIRESVFDLNGDRNLTHLCRYGPSLSDLTTQIRRQGFVPGIEAFQVLYGQDSDRDGHIESWVRAGHWSDPAEVLGVKFGLLLSGEDAVAEPLARDFVVLDSVIRKRADGKLRKVVQFTAALRGRSG